MVRVPHPGRPGSAEPRLRQDFEGHGLQAPQPFNRGFERKGERPASAASAPRAAASAESGKRGRRKNAQPALHLTAHVPPELITAGMTFRVVLSAVSTRFSCYGSKKVYFFLPVASMTGRENCCKYFYCKWPRFDRSGRAEAYIRVLRRPNPPNRDRSGLVIRSLAREIAI